MASIGIMQGERRIGARGEAHHCTGRGVTSIDRKGEAWLASLKGESYCRKIKARALFVFRPLFNPGMEGKHCPF